MKGIKLTDKWIEDNLGVQNIMDIFTPLTQEQKDFINKKFNGNPTYTEFITEFYSFKQNKND